MQVSTVPSNGNPARVLASTTIPEFSISRYPPGSRIIGFFGKQVPVVAGQQYALVVGNAPGSEGYSWLVPYGDYPNGQLYGAGSDVSWGNFGSSIDGNFAVYVVPDTTPPTTTATLSEEPNIAGWNNSNVTVALDATENSGGTGVKNITYSATGAQAVESTTVTGDSASVPIDTEGETTITYHATDNVGNAEPDQAITVKLDKSAPTLVGTTPENKQTGVSRDVEPTATFSDEMDPVTLSTSTTKLYQWNAKKKKWQPVAVTPTVDGSTVTLDPYPNEPTRLLAANKKFKVTFTTGTKNLAGIPLSSNTSWIFTTGGK
jgi:hypothetical protein